MTSESTRDIRVLLELNKRERLIMEYFLKQISAGELIAVLDLKEEIKKRVKQGESDLISELDDTIIARELYLDLALLVKRGLLEYRNGVYRLPQWIIDEIKKKKKRASPRTITSLMELIES